MTGIGRLEVLLHAFAGPKGRKSYSRGRKPTARVKSDVEPQRGDSALSMIAAGTAAPLGLSFFGDHFPAADAAGYRTTGPSGLKCQTL